MKVLKTGKATAVVIVNPYARRFSPAVRTRVLNELRGAYRLEAVASEERANATKLAAEAARDGARVVIAFGGDGHVNEIVNGIAGAEACLGIIPGGTMDVFARNLGIPLDPVAAAARLAGVGLDGARRVNLGMLDGRCFTFCAGCGFDAEAAEWVERNEPSKRRVGGPFFYWSALRVLAGSRRYRAPTMTLAGDFGEVEAAMVVASNAGPYAYFLGRPVVLAPEADLAGGIDVFALRAMHLREVPAYARRVLVTGDLASHPQAFYRSDLDSFEVTSPEPFSRHVDGEPLEPSCSATLSVARNALEVLAGA